MGKTEVTVTVGNKINLLICSQCVILINDKVNMCINLSLSKLVGCNKVEWSNYITDGEYSLSDVTAQGTNSVTGETPVDLVAEGILTKVTVTHNPSFVGSIDIFKIVVEFGPLITPITVEDIAIELCFSNILCRLNACSFCVMTKAIITPPPQEPPKDECECSSGCKCIIYDGVTNGSGPHAVYVGPRTIVRDVFKPSQIISNPTVSEIDDVSYQNISLNDGNVKYFDAEQSVLFCLNCPDDVTFFKQINITDVVKILGKFSIKIWNNEMMMWDMVGVNDNPNSSLEERLLKIPSSNLAKYFDNDKNAYLMYEEIGGPKTGFNFNVTQQGYSQRREVSTIITTCQTVNITGGEYFTLNSALDTTQYYVWMDNGVATDPAPAGLVGVPVDISFLTMPDDHGVAVAIQTAVDANPDFTATINNSTITVVNTDYGDSTNIADVNTTFKLTTVTEGRTDTTEIFTLDTTNTFGTFNGGEYFVINSALDIMTYYVWIDVTGDGMTNQPTIPTGKISVPVDITGVTDDADIASIISTTVDGLSDFTASNVNNIVTVQNVIDGDTTDVVDGLAGLCMDYIEVCLVCTKDLIPGSSGSIGRNWLFGNSQGGGSGNVGLEISLDKIGKQGQISRVLLCKFRRDAVLDLSGGDRLSGVRLLMYSNISFDMGISITECTLDPNNPDQPPNLLYPRIGDGNVVINDNVVTVGQLKRVYGLGSNAYDKCAQCVDFNFDPPLLIKECGVELYLSNYSEVSSTASTGIYQVYVLTQTVE